VILCMSVHEETLREEEQVFIFGDGSNY